MLHQCLDRREFVVGLLSAAGLSALARAAEEKLPPVRAITKGPKFHWFGYYDKWEFDPTDRYVLGMEVEFEHRSPRPDDVIKIGMVDLQDNDRWIELGQSKAWGWQQGCMLQWRPGSKTEVVWNDRDGDHFVCQLVDVKSGKKRTLPHPVYTLSPDGKTALGLDFRRVNDMRPGYGYAGLQDPNRDILAPKDSGIYRLDLDTGKAETIVAIADVLPIKPHPEDLSKKKHYFNHLLYNTDGSRFIFLHRWGPPGGRWGGGTRGLTADAAGKKLFCWDPSGGTSHFVWRDPRTILVWTKDPDDLKRSAFLLFEDQSDKHEVIGKGVMTVNGHCTYLPGNEWILNDTYPDAARNQNPYLYNVKSGKAAPLGHFRSPPEYRGEWRCDTHPRFSHDGKKVVIDSPHGDNGRQLYLIDISGIV
ncbi:MAG: hypothetical protein AB7K24_10525 [Gemmataceae bacterium]